jgi:hypothetical protein
MHGFNPAKFPALPPVEWLEYLHIALRVLENDEKGTLEI